MMIECAGDHSGQVVLSWNIPQAQANTSQFAWLEQLVATSATG